DPGAGEIAAREGKRRRVRRRGEGRGAHQLLRPGAGATGVGGGPEPVQAGEAHAGDAPARRAAVRGDRAAPGASAGAGLEFLRGDRAPAGRVPARRWEVRAPGAGAAGGRLEFVSQAKETKWESRRSSFA